MVWRTGGFTLMLQNWALFRVYVNDCHYDRISGRAFLCINDQPWKFGINTPSSPLLGKKIFINKHKQRWSIFSQPLTLAWVHARSNALCAFGWIKKKTIGFRPQCSACAFLWAKLGFMIFFLHIYRPINDTVPRIYEVLHCNYDGEIGQKLDLVLTFDWRVLFT